MTKPPDTSDAVDGRAPTSSDLAELVAAIGRPDQAAREAARAAGPPPAGPAGRLDVLATWLAGVQGRTPATPPARPRLLVLGNDIPARTARVASDVGVEPRVVTEPTVVTAPAGGGAVTPADAALHAVQTGAATADAEVDAGADLMLLALPDPGLQVPAATLTALLTGSDASAVTAPGLDDAAWIAACAATRDMMRHARLVLGDQMALLAAVDAPQLAVATGVLLGAAARRTPVLLDGPASAAAALVAARVAFRATDWWLAAHLSPDPAHRLALARLSLEPLLDLGLRGDDGTGALLAVPVLRAAVDR